MALSMSTSVLVPVDYTLVIQTFTERNLSVLALITTLLTDKWYKNHALTKDLVENAGMVLVHILGHPRLPDNACNKACALVESIYA